MISFDHVSSSSAIDVLSFPFPLSSSVTKMALNLLHFLSSVVSRKLYLCPLDATQQERQADRQESSTSLAIPFSEKGKREEKRRFSFQSTPAHVSLHVSP